LIERMEEDDDVQNVYHTMRWGNPCYTSINLKYLNLPLQIEGVFYFTDLKILVHGNP
jgi:hypothetical protein